MKIELKKETKTQGDIFYNILIDEVHEKSFWAGNVLTGEKCCYDGKYGEAKALAKAKEYYDKRKANGQVEHKYETIQSEEIPTI